MAALVAPLTTTAFAEEPAPATGPEVVDGVVQPKRPIGAAIDQAMEFLKLADGDYVPGNIDGPLAGYFTSAFVNEDGSRSNRQLAFPARQHAPRAVQDLLSEGQGTRPESPAP